MGMILRIASSRIVGQGDIVGRSGYFSLNLSANSVMRGRLDARRTLKSLVADLRLKKIAGQQLQLLRLEKNLTQEQMSEKLNLSTSAYCKIEYGETDLTLTRLDKIAKVLDISALALFSHISKNMHSYSDNNNENENAVPNYDDLRELIKANSRIIDLLCKRIDLLEQHL